MADQLLQIPQLPENADVVQTAVVEAPPVQVADEAPAVVADVEEGLPNDPPQALSVGGLLVNVLV